MSHVCASTSSKCNRRNAADIPTVGSDCANLRRLRVWLRGLVKMMFEFKAWLRF
jgi:hypothetical protein